MYKTQLIQHATRTVITHLDQLGVGVAFVLHLHDLDHMEVDELIGAALGDGENGVDDDVGQDVSHLCRELGGQRGLGHVHEELALLVGIRFALCRGDFQSLAEREMRGGGESDSLCGIRHGTISLYYYHSVSIHHTLKTIRSTYIEDFEGDVFGLFKTLADDSGMKTLLDVSVGLFEEFADDEDVGGGAVARDVILRRGRPRDQGGRGMLNLHLVQQDVTVLGQFDVARARHQHF